jgi:hypothetical protein
MQRTNGKQQNDLDERILDRVRQDPRTQSELVREVGEAESRVRSQLQFLDGAGYVEKNEETGEYEFRDHPGEPHLFEEHPRLRWLAFGAVFLLFGALYFYLFSVFLEPMLGEPTLLTEINRSYVRSLAVLLSLPFAWMTARIIISPSFIGKGLAYDVFSWRS